MAEVGSVRYVAEVIPHDEANTQVLSLTGEWISPGRMHHQFGMLGEDDFQEVIVVQGDIFVRDPDVRGGAWQESRDGTNGALPPFNLSMLFDTRLTVEATLDGIPSYRVTGSSRTTPDGLPTGFSTGPMRPVVNYDLYIAKDSLLPLRLVVESDSGFVPPSLVLLGPQSLLSEPLLAKQVMYDFSDYDSELSIEAPELSAAWLNVVHIGGGGLATEVTDWLAARDARITASPGIPDDVWLDPDTVIIMDAGWLAEHSSDEGLRNLMRSASSMGAGLITIGDSPSTLPEVMGSLGLRSGRSQPSEAPMTGFRISEIGGQLNLSSYTDNVERLGKVLLQWM